VDDWGTNTHKVFNSLPTKKQIERSIKQYLKSDKIAAKYGWREYDAIYSNNNNFGFDEGNDTQQYEILRLENDQVMLKID
jgi:hypothetical protein